MLSQPGYWAGNLFLLLIHDVCLFEMAMAYCFCFYSFSSFGLIWFYLVKSFSSWLTLFLPYELSSFMAVNIVSLVV